MKIASILQEKGSEVVTVPVDASIRDALELMHRHRIGAVVVTRGAEIAGVLSERDIVIGLRGLGAGVLERSVGDCMTSPAITVTPNDDVVTAMAVMTARRVRHLPVLSDGQLTGLVSIGDLVKHRISEVEREAELLKDYIQRA